MELLKQQYELIKGSRGVMLGFIEREVATQLKTPIKEFNGSNVMYLLVHVTNTYLHWIGNFALKKGLSFTDDNNVDDVVAIKNLFDEVDVLMMEFFNNFDDAGINVTNTLRSGKTTDISVLELFTHMITHEFHHKGQIMALCRLLGHIPPDTDVIRF